jgi:hypothetical protein
MSQVLNKELRCVVPLEVADWDKLEETEGAFLV